MVSIPNMGVGAAAGVPSSTRSGMPVEDLLRELLEDSEVREEDFSLVEDER